jgi:hypothetical protein
VKPSFVLVPGLVAVLLVGCHTMPPLDDGPGLTPGLFDRVFDDAIRNAIVTQHCLFDYHFERNAATLNGLGLNDLKVLATHYREHAGPLHVRQGEAPQDLYEARVKEVQRLMIEAGIPKDRIAIQDAPPGGDGVRAEHALQIVGAKTETPHSDQPPKSRRTQTY